MTRLKILDKKIFFDGEFIKLYKSTVQIPTGEKRIHYNAYRVPTVLIVPIDTDFNVYLIKQYRYLYENTLLEVIAGTVDKGEEPLVSAKRELLEEAGIKAHSWKHLLDMNLAGSYIKASVSLFLAQELTFGKAALEDDEEIELVKMPLEEAVEKVMMGEIMAAGAIAGILLIDKMRREGKL